MDSQKEIQARYVEVLASCYEQYSKGQRCQFESQPEQIYDCTNCQHNNRNQFCKANRMLKKLIRLLAESLADDTDTAPLRSAVPGAPITDEDIQNFKALNVAVAFSSPKSGETLWLVPERMGQPGIEFTPEDIRILDAAVTTFDGEILEARRLKEHKAKKS